LYGQLAEDMNIEQLFSYPMASRARALVGLAIALAVAYFVLPPGTGSELIRLIAPAIGVAAVLSGIAAYQPERTLPWALLAIALACTGAANAVWAALFFASNDTFPAVPDVFHLVAAVLLVAMATLLGRDTAAEDSLSAIESIIVSVAVGVGVWLVVIEPFLSDRAVPVGDRVWAAAIPLLCAIALAVALRTAVQVRFEFPAAVLLALGLGVELIADVTRSVQELRGSFGPGGLSAALSIVAALILAAASLDPTMAVTHRPNDDAAPIGFGRVVWLSVAALTPLTVLLALTAVDLGSRSTRVLAGVCAVVVVVLALARMWGLVARVRQLTERQGQDRLAAMVEHSSDVVMLVNDSGQINYASAGLLSTLGHRSTDWIGRPLIDLVANDDRDASAVELQRVVGLGSGGTVKFEVSLVRVDGQPRRMEATIANLLGGDAVDGVVATFRDVTEQRNLERQLSHRAFHDELTGLANRALFLDRMDTALKVARPDNDALVVLFIDLDDFKAVNDALGHGVGDQLLRAIADRIRRVSATADTPARLGGDEFAILLEDRGGADRAIDVAESLLQLLREPVLLAGQELAVLASVGVAVATPGMTTSGLLRDADIAMYEAKRAGKSQIKIFDPAMRLTATRHLEFRTELGVAIERNQLRLMFQPMISLTTGHVVGAEALLRWDHPVRGEISPGEFIPIAERAGLIGPIGHWVLDESFRQAARWQRSGPRQISVNVSAIQIRSVEFVEQVREALATHQLDATHVMLEITETMFVEEVEAATGNLEELRRLGIRIAIDDFGTGYCSLSYLQRFPVDVLKIDRRFVEELGQQPKSSTLAKMILQLTAGLDVTSVAEGIEKPAQLAELKALKCDIGQGFLLAVPMEAEAIAARFGATDLVASTRATINPL
jgi:diguanylate cyclase (GGDEF)-like protein/PAS domain S-box-containing protein